MLRYGCCRHASAVGSPVWATSTAGRQWQYGSMAGANLGIDAYLNGAVPFPSDEASNIDISASEVDPNSAELIASIGLDTGLHPDFGSGTYDHAIIGIPYVKGSDFEDGQYLHALAGAARTQRPANG